MSATRDPHRDQPLPTPGQQPVQDALIRAVQERRDYGIRKYGRPLETHNGRDALTDAWEEALDLVTYLTQMRLERGDALAAEQEPASLSPATARAALREAAEQLVEADLGPRPGHTHDYTDGWSDATLRAQSHLRMMADRAGAPAPTYRIPLGDLTGDELEALYAERDMLRRNMQRAQTDLAVRDAAMTVQAKRIARVVAAASVCLAEDECGESERRGYHSALSDVRRALDEEQPAAGLRRMADETQQPEAEAQWARTGGFDQHDDYRTDEPAAVQQPKEARS